MPLHSVKLRPPRGTDSTSISPAGLIVLAVVFVATFSILLDILTKTAQELEKAKPEVHHPILRGPADVIDMLFRAASKILTTPEYLALVLAVTLIGMGLSIKWR